MKAKESLRRLVAAALFAAAIAVMTAYFHIMLPTGGYIHIGDALIYLGACLLPTPYAIVAAAIGGGLADLLSAPMWVLPTLIVKAAVVLPFTRKHETILCPRNVMAVFLSGLLSPAGYGLANVMMSGTLHAFLPQFLGTLIQSVGSGAVFFAVAAALDGAKLKSRLAM